MLDIKTLLFASIAARAGFALFFLLFSMVGGARTAFLWWLLSISLSCQGLWLLYGSSANPSPEPLEGTIIYLIFGLSIACVWKGGAAYFDRRIPSAAVILTALGPATAYGGVIQLAPSEPFALVPVLLLMAFSLVRAALVFCNRATWRSPSQWVVVAALFAYAVALASSALLLFLTLQGADSAAAPPPPDHRQYALFVDQFSSTLIYLGLIAMTLEHAHAQLKAHAATDPLTGLANRRGAQDRSVALLGERSRGGRPMAVLLADIDHFKAINDHYGHEAGDLVLKAFARRMESVARPQRDILARWGGEEFLIILPDRGGAAALRLARRLCRAIACQPFLAGDQAIAVTVSIGVAAFRENETELSAVVSRADRALYRIKSDGRNQARLEDEVPDPRDGGAPAVPLARAS